MAESRHVDRALSLFGDELARKRNVVGLGKVASPDGGECLAVYVEKKVPEAELAAADLVPKVLKVEAVEVETQVIEQGPVSLESL